MPRTESALQWKVRLHDELHRRIDIAAKKSGVSRNTEVVARLERSFDRDPIVGLAADVKRLLAMQSGKANV
jgi:HicB family